jgi:hypothetical protein
MLEPLQIESFSVKIEDSGVHVRLKNEKSTIRPLAKKKLTEQFTVASLYDYWVKMYMRRKERS